MSFGVFGYDTPVIGEYESIPTLSAHAKILEILSRHSGQLTYSSLVSGAAQLEIHGRKRGVALLGAQGERFFSQFPRTRFLSGSAPSQDFGLGWIVVSRGLASDLEKASGQPLRLGDELQLEMATVTGFSIRAVRLAGVVAMSGKIDLFNSLCFTDPTTARALFGLGQGNASSAGEGAAASPPPAAGGDFNPDVFFSAEGSAVPAPPENREGGMSVESLRNQLSAFNKAELSAQDPESGDWHFIVMRAKDPAQASRLRAEINRELSRSGVSAIAVDWAGSAGFTASMMIFFKNIFNIAMAILATVVVFMLMNGVSISVFERAGEIGTMRALGAQASFVRKLLLAESACVCLVGSLLGALLAFLVFCLVRGPGIPLHNSYLISVFGTALLKPSLSPLSALLALALSLACGALAAIYPAYAIFNKGVARNLAAL
jgi:putative ABC transport system permease protein